MRLYCLSFLIVLVATVGLRAEAPNQPLVVRDRAYVADKAHARQKLDLIVPVSADNKPLPLVVWIHGGGWTMGDKNPNPAQLLLIKGYAIASINYRFSQDAVWPAQVIDCRSAIRYLRSHAKEFNIDPDRIAVWGASAGGHLVAMLGMSSDAKFSDEEPMADVSCKVNCVIDYFGPTDFSHIAGDRNNQASQLVAKLLGGNVKDKPEQAKSASPVTYATKDDAPMLVVHGKKDDLVPYEQSVRLEEACKNASIPVQLETIDNAGHGGQAFFDMKRQKLILQFLEDHLSIKSDSK